jgi:hypothetical protein
MERRIFAYRNRADEIAEYFVRLLGIIHLKPNRPLLNTRTKP